MQPLRLTEDSAFNATSVLGRVDGSSPDATWKLLKSEKARLRRSTRELVALRERLHNRYAALQKRDKQRLEKLRKWLSDKSAAFKRQAHALETQRTYAAQVVGQRHAVMEFRRLLSEAEQRMIQRWGIQKALGWAIRALICLALLLGVSGLAAEHYSRQSWVASAVVRYPQAPVGPTVAWAMEQRALLAKTETINNTLAHLAQSGYTGPLGPQELRRMLENSLTLEAPAPGLLWMRIEGEAKQSLAPLLGAAVAVYTVIPNIDGWPRPTVMQEATLAAEPTRDNRNPLRAMFFSASLGVTLLLSGLMGWLTIRSRRGEAVNVDVATVTDDNTWKAYEKVFQSEGVPKKPLF